MEGLEAKLEAKAQIQGLKHLLLPLLPNRSLSAVVLSARRGLL